MKTKLSIFLILVFLLAACGLFKPTIIYQEYDKIPNTKNQNTCKLLKDSVLVYAVFVDTDIYHPWTEFDIESTMDSLKKASNWIQQQAGKYDKAVSF